MVLVWSAADWAWERPRVGHRVGSSWSRSCRGSCKWNTLLTRRVFHSDIGPTQRTEYYLSVWTVFLLFLHHLGLLFHWNDSANGARTSFLQVGTWLSFPHLFGYNKAWDFWDQRKYVCQLFFILRGLSTRHRRLCTNRAASPPLPPCPLCLCHIKKGRHCSFAQPLLWQHHSRWGGTGL